MKTGISITGDVCRGFVAEVWPAKPGSPIVGRGTTPLEAIGALFWHDPTLGVTFTLETIEVMRERHPDHCWSTAR